MKIQQILYTAIGLLISAIVLAEVKPEDAIKARMEKAASQLKVRSVTASPLPGIYEVELNSGEVLYSSADGKYFVAGNLYEITDAGFVNITEEKKSALRKEELAKLDTKDMIVFPVNGSQKTKAAVTVFTDVDCGYCRKLHQEIPKLNELGIEVRYMAFPRAGAGSKTYNTMVSVWCAADTRKAMTAAKNSGKVMAAKCKNPVLKHYRIGQKLGVNGTPAILLADGTLLPGYLSAENLAAKVLPDEPFKTEPRGAAGNESDKDKRS